MWFLFPVVLVTVGLEIFYQTTETNYSFKTKQITAEYKDAEILLFGNSHAFYGLDPTYFSKRTFNIANISQSLYFDELLFEKHQPNLPNLKAVVFTISYFSLSQEDNTSEDTWRKYFYHQQMDLDVPIISEFDMRNYSLALARRFNKSVALVDTFFREGTIVSCYPNGYGMQDEKDMVESKEAITPIIVKKHEDGLTDFSTNQARLERIIKKCKEENIKVFLVEMPVFKNYYEALNPKKVTKIVETLSALEASHENVFYYNFSQDPYFQEEDLRDADHLTNEGAKKCSVLLNSKVEEKLR
ncbi:MAG: hypothetical protein R2786_10985 [Flavobacteriaceae bacterium]